MAETQPESLLFIIISCLFYSGMIFKSWASGLTRTPAPNSQYMVLVYTGLKTVLLSCSLWKWREEEGASRQGFRCHFHLSCHLAVNWRWCDAGEKAENWVALVFPGTLFLGAGVYLAALSQGRAAASICPPDTRAGEHRYQGLRIWRWIICSIKNDTLSWFQIQGCFVVVLVPIVSCSFMLQMLSAK